MEVKSLKKSKTGKIISDLWTIQQPLKLPGGQFAARIFTQLGSPNLLPPFTIPHI